MFHFNPGINGGLTVGFSIDHEEWTPGPYMSYSGMVVSIHNPSQETVLLADVGLSVAVGKTVGFLLYQSTYDLLVGRSMQCAYSFMFKSMGIVSDTTAWAVWYKRLDIP